jgi:hypothetical protein
LLGAVAFWGEGPGRNGRRTSLDTYYRAFGPRLGLAYSVDRRTVVRAYYGINYSPISVDGSSGGNLPNYGQASGSNSQNSPDGGIHPAFNWNDGVPYTVPYPPFLNPTQLNGQGILWMNPQQNRPEMVQDFGFAIEREVAGINLRAEYIGKLTHNITGYNNTGTSFQENQLPMKYLSLGNLLNQDINSDAARAAGIYPPYPGFTGTVQWALLKWPQYPFGVTNITRRDNFSLYHAMQLNAQKRLGRNLTFLVAYTLSKNLIGVPVQYYAEQWNLRKGLIAVDQPQSLAISYVYDLPFGPGKRFLQTTNPVLKQVVGYWQVSGIQTYFSGQPVNMGSFVLRNNSVPISTGTTCDSYNPGDPNSRYMNINAFSLPAPFTSGDTRVLPSTRTCASQNENISVKKRFPLSESKLIVFGAEFFNILNRHWFTGLTTNVAVPSSFGRFTSASSSRQIQFLLKVEF